MLCMMSSLLSSLMSVHMCCHHCFPLWDMRCMLSSSLSLLSFLTSVCMLPPQPNTCHMVQPAESLARSAGLPALMLSSPVACNHCLSTQHWLACRFLVAVIMQLQPLHCKPNDTYALKYHVSTCIKITSHAKVYVLKQNSIMHSSAFM